MYIVLNEQVRESVPEKPVSDWWKMLFRPFVHGDEQCALREATFIVRRLLRTYCPFVDAHVFSI